MTRAYYYVFLATFNALVTYFSPTNDYIEVGIVLSVVCLAFAFVSANESK